VISAEGTQMPTSAAPRTQTLPCEQSLSREHARLLDDSSQLVPSQASVFAPPSVTAFLSEHVRRSEPLSP
jgi:hypothetical protein